MSNKYQEKPQHKGYQSAIEASCDYCGKIFWETVTSYNRKKRHFCCQGCYSAYRREIMPPNEQPSWRGGVSNTEAHRRWKAKNPERMAFLKARRYAREKGTIGKHSFEEWQALKKQYNNRCAICRKRKVLTQDHIIPLSEGGTDYISNIQPLCRNCNSQKWKHKTMLF